MAPPSAMTAEQQAAYKLRVQWSMKALQHVASTGIQSTNRSLAEHAKFWNKFIVYAARWDNPDLDRDPTEANKLALIRASARDGAKVKLGNCQEFSALAFSYLYDNAPKAVRPLSWVASNALGATHALVMLGPIKLGDPTYPAECPPDTVCCDPWKEMTHAAIFWKKSQGIYNGNAGVNVVYTTALTD